MKKLSIWMTVFVACAGMTVAPGVTSAQDTKAQAHQVGLIDMAHVFKNYDKFKEQTESLQAEAEAAQAKANAMIEQMKQLQGQLAGLQAGSPDHSKIEAQMIELQTRLQTFRQVEQRDIVRKQAEVYKSIYMEVQTAVRQYAQYYNYTLIMRFNRQEVAETTNPQEIIQSMNRPVVYYQQQDDLTDPILQFLNESHKKAKSANAGGAGATN